ncbi:MAG: hypothetical protein AAGG79_07690 [Pseudomonadota bacterium]
MSASDVTFVIRSVGERTEGRCRDAILAQGVPSENVVTVRQTPFLEAMRVAYQSGIEAGRLWTYCIDADVILRPAAVSTVLNFAARQKANVFEVQAFVLDKLMISLRMAGNHLFRTAHLRRMIAAIPQTDVLRPETEAMKSLVRQGMVWRAVPYVAGLHDFGQANRDIFRKSFTHSHKHLHLLPQMIAGLRRRAGEDADFGVALQGIAEGFRAERDVTIDARHAPFHERFRALAIPEKPAIGAAELAPGSVDKILRRWGLEDDVCVRGLPISAADAVALDGDSQFNGLGRLRAILAQRGSEIGPARIVPFALGTGLEMLGQRLKVAAATRQPAEMSARVKRQP